MSSRDRSPVAGLPLVGLLGLVCIVAAQERPPICEQIAKTYGLASFPQVEQIRYTFNVDLGQIKLSRSWLWEPKVDRVSYEGKDKNGKTVKHAYLRTQLSSQPAEVGKEIDPAFINDQYWLLFPLHLSWDKDAKVEDQGTQKGRAGRGRPGASLFPILRRAAIRRVICTNSSSAETTKYENGSTMPEAARSPPSPRAGETTRRLARS